MSGHFLHTPQSVEKAIIINSHLAWKYHLKFPTIPKDEFVSIGYVAIAECFNHKKRINNFEAFLKTCIQNRYRDHLRWARRQQHLYIIIFRIAGNLRHTSYRKITKKDYGD